MEISDRNKKILRVIAAILTIIITLILIILVAQGKNKKTDKEDSTIQETTTNQTEDKKVDSTPIEPVVQETIPQAPVEVREHNLGLSYVIPKSFGTSILTLPEDPNDEFRANDGEISFTNTDFRLIKNPNGIGCGGFESEFVEEKIIKTLDGEEFYISLSKYTPYELDAEGMEVLSSEAPDYGISAVNFHGTNEAGETLTMNEGYGALSIGHICGAGPDSEKSLENAKVRVGELAKFVESIKLD